MADRIDALGPSPERLTAFSGALLETELDAELQLITEQASRELGAPIALVSLVLSRIQFFRAHYGLPEDLAVARATDRDASFCQFVVRDGAPFEVADARHDDRVPKELVDRFGIGSYLGMPVRANDEVVGSLCVMGPEERTFSASQRMTLAALADRVSRRLESLAAARGAEVAREKAMAPAFAELRNLLQSLFGKVAGARVASAELAAVARLAELPDTAVIAGALSGAGSALTDSADSLTAVEHTARRIRDQVLAIEEASINGHALSALGDVVAAALELSHHYTKLVGGVECAPIAAGLKVRAMRPAAVSILGAALAELALRANRGGAGQTGIKLEAEDHGDAVEVHLSSHAESVEWSSLAERIAEIAAFDTSVAITSDGAGLTLRFRRRWD